MKNIKSYSGLEKLSKKLLEQLNSEIKYDSQSNHMRRRYLSYFHARNKTKEDKFALPNRRSI